MIVSFDTAGCRWPWACLRYSWIVISPKTDWVVSKTVSCSGPCSPVDFNGFYVTCPFSMGIAFWDYPSIPTWSVWFRHSKTVPISGFGYETDLLDTRNGNTVNLTEMSFKFEFFHLNLFVSGPVFDYLSNERGLVRVCGFLGAVLCAAFEVRRFSSVSKFEFLTVFANCRSEHHTKL